MVQESAVHVAGGRRCQSFFYPALDSTCCSTDRPDNIVPSSVIGVQCWRVLNCLLIRYVACSTVGHFVPDNVASSKAMARDVIDAWSLPLPFAKWPCSLDASKHLCLDPWSWADLNLSQRSFHAPVDGPHPHTYWHHLIKLSSLFF